jgi:hypothetical protein
MAADAVETLRRVNGCLRMARDSLRPERKHCSSIKPRDFSDIVSQILRAEECLRQCTSSARMPELEKEKLEYRCNLENLKRSLPDLHVRLLAHKAQLERTKEDLTAKTAWARARAETL